MNESPGKCHIGLRATMMGLAMCVMANTPYGLYAQSDKSAQMAEYKEMKWTDTAAPAGGKQAQLWGDPKAADQGVMLRWRFNSKLRDQTRTLDARYVVLAGTFTVEIGSTYREFGPGGYVNIPKGVKHTIGCEAAGECRLFMQLSAATEPVAPKQ